nr:MAG TPA: hypothetical protein [Caudoviricetes sp.]
MHIQILSSYLQKLKTKHVSHVRRVAVKCSAKFEGLFLCPLVFFFYRRF